HGVSEKLITGVLDLQYFVELPQTFLLAMLAVLGAAGIWLNLATFLGLPVSASHATVGALTGVGLVAVGEAAIQWPTLGVISLTWIVTPLASGVMAAVLYRGICRLRDGSIAQLQEWIPWLGLGLVLVFGGIVLPTVTERLQFGLPAGLLSDRALTLSSGALMLLILNVWLLSRGTLTQPESLFAQLQLVSAAFVAFAHGSNDVGNAIAPLAAIIQTQFTGHIPFDGLAVPGWILGFGGAGMVAGLAVWGKQVIATIGAGIIALQPSGGFAAELATAITILVASRWGLPISTSHALVGGVVGIGLVGTVPNLQIETLKSIFLTWMATIPLAAAIGAITFKLLEIIIL
ncbi:inorganic phosphate transporter, partial [filamentous cyanobacterium LEGE 11480]